MNIQWFGHACFRISEKIDGQEIAVVTAPFGKETGLFPPKIKADIVVVNNDDPQYSFSEKVVGNTEDAVLIIDRPGEYETKKVFITGFDHVVRGEKEQTRTIIYKITMGSISIAHLGGVRTKLTEEELDVLGTIDVLLVPVGGNDVLDGAKAAALARQIEPRIIVPMEYAIKDLKIKRDDVKKFIAEVGGKVENESKLKITRKDLPEDKTLVYILEKS